MISWGILCSGILEPKIDNAEVGMKLAVTGMIVYSTITLA